MLSTGPNLRSCGGKSWSRTHAAANREFDDLPGRSLAPISGLEGGLLSRYLRIMATNEDTWPLSGSIMGLEGGFLSRYVANMARRMAALWLHIGAGGRPFVPDMRPLWRRPCCPPAPLRGWRAAVCPDMRRLWRRHTEGAAPHRDGIRVNINFIFQAVAQKKILRK